MRHQPAKFFSVVALSLALLYSGVAWAMGSCIGDHDHGDHNHMVEIAAPDDQAAALARADTHGSAPVIHCASVNEQVGPAMQGVSAKVRYCDKAAALTAVSFLSTLPDRRPTIMWLQALFRNNSTVAHHLFLAVLQI